MRQTILLFALVALGITACTKEETPITPSLTIPATYDGSNYDNDVSNILTLRSQLNALVSEAKTGRDQSNTVDFATLDQLYKAGTPSVASLTNTYYATLLDGQNGFLAELAKASGNSYTPGTPSGDGGVYGAYLFDENGLELEQLVEKGLFGALNYYQAVQLMNGPINQQALNQMLALFGAHASFPNTPSPSKTAHPDVYMANYAARRSDINDENSLYNRIKKAFITAQAAMNAGDNYLAERNLALADIRLNWEKANAATIINYCHSVVSTLSQTAPTDAQKASALHAYSECVGFLHGWRQLPADSKRISDTQIDEILSLMLAAPGNTPESYKLITESLTYLPNIQQVITRLQAIYGFTNAEVEGFRNNWVAIQNR